METRRWAWSSSEIPRDRHEAQCGMGLGVTWLRGCLFGAAGCSLRIAPRRPESGGRVHHDAQGPAPAPGDRRGVVDPRARRATARDDAARARRSAGPALRRRPHVDGRRSPGDNAGLVMAEVEGLSRASPPRRSPTGAAWRSPRTSAQWPRLPPAHPYRSWPSTPDPRPSGVPRSAWARPVRPRRRSGGVRERVGRRRRRPRRPSTHRPAGRPRSAVAVHRRVWAFARLPLGEHVIGHREADRAAGMSISIRSPSSKASSRRSPPPGDVADRKKKKSRRRSGRR